MNFNRLPTELVASIMDKCNYQTASKMRKTSNRMNKIVKGYKYDKLDAGNILFVDESETLEVNVQSQKFPANNCGFYCFDGSYAIPQEENGLKPHHHHVYDKINDVLVNVSSMTHIQFEGLRIDDTLVPMLKSLPFDWKKIDACFFTCDYHIFTEDLLALWKMFKTVDECDSFFNGKYDASDVVNDQLMVQSLPHITLNTMIYTEQDMFIANPAITDITLEFLAENRPVNLCMGRFISSFTEQGVLELFKKIVLNRDSSIEKWFIGVVQFDNDTFNRILDDFEDFNTDFSKLFIETTWHQNAYELVVEYKKVNSVEVGTVSVALIKTPEVVEIEQLWLEVNRDWILRQRRDFYLAHGMPLDDEMLNLPDEESDMEIDEEDFDIDENNINNAML